MIQTIEEYFKIAKLHIAKCDYGGAKYIADKQVIADSFAHRIFNNECGCIIDEYNGNCWIVYINKATNMFTYQRAV